MIHRIVDDLYTDIRKLHHKQKVMTKKAFIDKYEDKIVYYLNVLGEITTKYGYIKKVDDSKETCNNMLGLRDKSCGQELYLKEK